MIQTDQQETVFPFDSYLNKRQMTSSGLHPSTITRILKDVRALSRKPFEDITVHVNEEDISTIRATMIGPESTPYENGIFHVRLQFDGDFPTVPPKGYFDTPIFHPNVACKSGEICVNTLKKDWKPNYGLSHILMAIRSLLIDPNYDSALNEEAGKMLRESYQDFVNRAKVYTKIHAPTHKPTCSDNKVELFLLVCAATSTCAKQKAVENAMSASKEELDVAKSLSDKKTDTDAKSSNLSGTLETQCAKNSDSGSSAFDFEKDGVTVERCNLMMSESKRVKKEVFANNESENTNTSNTSDNNSNKATEKQHTEFVHNETKQNKQKHKQKSATAASSKIKTKASLRRL
ncbi:hypothetical protein RFI_20064 [Reticulomyxa filosa]|uniref:E2 ubiquitin-conjugating enzyme n=1 Tax=Reticulomyxa filosa TaxID=46433 RepID=X6MUB4_RETFI|nr:hypothetical protein RFI_20064 [Reticulomyxa filosa]|eukprot:ETO17266.1 hypothetical protein RFI_20064 [Reticulomyxa filosa]